MDLTLLEISSGAADHCRGLSYCKTYLAWVEVVCFEVVHGHHSSHHFSQTSYLPDLMDSLSVIIGKSTIFSFPYAPTLGRDIGYTLIFGKQPQKIGKILHTLLTVPTSTPLRLD